MSKGLSALRDNHQVIYKGALFVLAIGLIVYLFPKEGKFKYEFQKGKPWLHENLIAPFDFAIIKSQDQIDLERSEVLERIDLYFVRDQNVSKEALISFRDQFSGLSVFDSLAPPRRDALLATAESLLEEVYEAGIVRWPESIAQEEWEEVRLLNSGVAEDAQTGKWFNIRSASQKIDERVVNSDWTQEERKVIVPLLLESLDYTIFYDGETTEKVRQSEIDNIALTRGMVQRGQSIILRGEVVDEDSYQKLNSLKNEFESNVWSKSNYYIIVSGQTILVSVVLLVLFLFLQRFRPMILADNNQIGFILLNIVMMVLMGTVLIRLAPAYLYLAPFCILPIMLRAFFDGRVAIFTHLVTVIIIGFVAPNPYEFVLLQLIAGIVSILTVTNLYQRVQLFISAAKIIGIYFVCYFALAILQEGSFEGIELSYFALFAGSGFLTLFSNPLIYAFEKTFGLVSDISLLELSDTNNKLLRQLAEKAPGTFQHSLQVANLAETAVGEINGNTLLVRTGALYHDIGKMVNPLFFIENQSTGMNPHDDLSFDDSARIIIEHVHQGIELAKKNNLPDRIIDFIRTHHGDSTVQYFYRQYVKSFPDESVDIAKFSYPGPLPFSKETAVLMMADSVEAASRSLKQPTADAIDRVVNDIIDHQMDEGQFAQADITLKEINLVRKVLKKKLLNIYHLRIEYPD
jgi:putative nucleotidyltransferase with HDIG domain